ncbi:MAG: DNA-binding protein [Desulfomonile tiedjei]|nr:DNA-binding protein [Desulfomonile tiedjei]
MEIKPIRTEEEYRAALARLGDIWDAEPDTPESDELDVLSVLVEAYEDEHYPMDPPDPIEAIKFRMEQMGLTRKDLEPYIGSRGRVSEVLTRKRRLSLDMIRNLNEKLGIPAEVLIARYPLESGRESANQ